MIGTMFCQADIKSPDWQETALKREELWSEYQFENSCLQLLSEAIIL